MNEVKVVWDEKNSRFFAIDIVRAINDEDFRRLIVQYIEKFGSASRVEIDELLTSKLSDPLSEQQKKNKITNLLSYIGIRNVIKVNEKKQWMLVM